MSPFRLTALAGTILLAGSALASPENGATGLWNREDGLGGVRIARCGSALCGDVIWLRDKAGPAHIG